MQEMAAIMAAVKAHSVFQTAMQKFLDLRAPSNDAVETKPALVNKVDGLAQSLQSVPFVHWQLATIAYQSQIQMVCSVGLDI